MIGSRIGHYEIVELMGVGGMGEVYRGRDLTLGREVAIKVLPAAWADDPDRLARLQREAKVLAQLDHPNVAAIHGLEEATVEGQPSRRLLVMQLAEGETLQDWIVDGRLGTERSLQIGLQIAAGLEAAHERGVVHRDLKPANVKVAEDAGGHPHVKILDFGLAKAFEADGSASDLSPELSASPTMMAATRTGIILGTAAYMSPEQARGKAVDKRADIWAFGVVLWEMLTGRKLFDGETVSDMLAGVLKSEPDFSRLPPDVPARVVRLLQRCLEKDPTKRLRDIGEARLILASPGDVALPVGSREIRGGVPAADTPGSRGALGVATRSLPWVVAGLSLGLAAWLWVARAPHPMPTFQLDVAAPPGSEYQLGGNSGLAIISPDGSRLAFAATSAGRRMLWVRSLATGEAAPLPGTEDLQYPFWSPDSSRLGFFANAQLKTVDISGGIPEIIAPAPNGRGGSWGDDGTIVFTPDGADTVHRVHQSGGAVDDLTTHDASRGENAHYFPCMLPGSERFLYFARGDSPETSGIYLARVDGTEPPVRVVASMSSGIYAPSFDGGPGHLLWVREGTLLAQPFDPESGALSGSAQAIAGGVRVEESQRGTFASVSNNGILAWADAHAADNELKLYSRDGTVTGTLPIEPGQIWFARLSPSSDRILFNRVVQGTSDIWLHDIATGTTRVIVANPGFDELASWSADGQSFIHLAAGEPAGIVLVDTSGAAQPRVVTSASAFGFAALTPDGAYAVYASPGADSSETLQAVSTDGSGETAALAGGGSLEGPADFSPDGQWLLVMSDRSGAFELWAARWVVDERGPRLQEPWHQVSTRGVGPGLGSPRWTEDDEILYLTADRTVMSVQATRSASALQLGRETALFTAPQDTQQVDFAHDGQQLLVLGTPYAAGQTVHVLTNWQSRLEAAR